MMQKFGSDRRGVAGIEFAICLTLLILGFVNAVDVGYYIYQRMQVEMAAQSGAHAGWRTCYDQRNMLPATQNCQGLDAAVTAAVQSTTLGKAVSLVSGYPKEGFYCVSSANLLQAVGDLDNKPGDCSEAGDPDTSPSDYIQVTVTYKYTPLFGGLTVMGASGTTSITQTSWMRLG